MHASTWTNIHVSQMSAIHTTYMGGYNWIYRAEEKKKKLFSKVSVFRRIVLHSQSILLVKLLLSRSSKSLPSSQFFLTLFAQRPKVSWDAPEWLENNSRVRQDWNRCQCGQVTGSRQPTVM